ncbi:unnamed protein product [Rotaria sordida]|uniref:U1 small nuclear ribonucleoprotein C n=1 Tax=Rotaria sordida TaxID=392033 RepID=A0A814XP82_9BILA|nr:unnamed protein product [Rotaria sordida]CAF1051341.1 unnamed protein product [Rotaria sordida]CAF1215241.1 unnamed protein product [Rotaria sordida]CAF3661079.1 unnamed protein product [Rotaria sordida]
MPKYYCDYCDTFLTHDSPSVRKTHCQGRKHKENVRDYYQKWMEEQAQKLIDQTTAAYKSGKLVNTPFPMGVPRLINPNIAPPWAFSLPPGMPPLGLPPNPAAMTALMTLRPPPGILPPGVPPPAVVPKPSTE